jgi:hypothetical protein
MIDSPSPDSLPAVPAPPSSPASPPQNTRADRLFAAVQAASLASMLMIFWCGIASRSSSHSFWTLPNLMAGYFYGQNSLQPNFSFHTLSGLSLHLLLSTIFALIFAAVVPPTLRPLTSLMLGILSATTWFYLLDGFFWRNSFPLVSQYSRRPSIFFSFVLLGICVGLYSVFVRSSKETQISGA